MAGAIQNLEVAGTTAAGSRYDNDELKTLELCIQARCIGLRIHEVLDYCDRHGHLMPKAKSPALAATDNLRPSEGRTTRNARYSFKNCQGNN